MPQLAVLGPIKAVAEGETLDLGGNLPKKLLATLVAHEEEAVSVPRLLEALWDGEPPPSGPATIQSYVSRLRRTLGPDVIETTAAGYRLHADNADVDAYRFLSISENLPTESDARLTAIEEALSLWRGAPFDDFEHVEFAARGLVETRSYLEEEKAALLSDSGRGSEAIGVLEKLISEEPFRESAWIALARILVSEGRPADAVRTFDRYRNKLSDIGLEPSPDLRSAESEVFATWRAGSRQQSRLPGPHTTFHGRSSEMRQLLLAIDERRQITLIGPGGMGKTRLAQETLRKLEQRSWLVRLEGIQDNSEVAAAVLTELGLESRGSPIESIVEALKPAPGLLILDNCEHVIEATARLTTSILRDTRATVLVTSREPLNMPGETLFELGPMDMDSACELYVERAGRVNPGLSPDPEQVELLCSAIDFMPLAIEIAASCARTLSPKDILDRLDSGQGLLDRKRRVSDPRHVTLDAMVDWSYSLLPEPVQRVFERLSVFVGDFDLEGAAAVAGFGEVEPESVADHVADLVERSMVQASAGLDSCLMLRTFKSFANKRLARTADRTEACNRHKDYHAAIAEEIGTETLGPDEVKAMNRASLASEDLEVALQWAVETDDFVSAGEILEGLFEWLYHRQPAAIMDWGQKVLRRISPEHDAYPIAAAWAATAALKRGDALEAMKIALSATSSDSATGVAWFIAGDAACYMGDLGKSVSYYEESLRRARLVGDDVAIVDALSRLMLSMVRNQGLFVEAMERSGELVDRLARVEAPSIRAHAGFALGSVYAGVDLQNARTHLRRSVDLARSVKNQYVQGMAMTELGSVRGLDGDLGEAQESLLEAIRVFKALGAHPHQWFAARYLAAILAKRGRLELGVKLLAAADASGIDPLANQTSLWSDVFDKLRAVDNYDRLVDESRNLDLQEAIALVGRRVTQE